MPLSSELDFVQSPCVRCEVGRVSGRVAEGGQQLRGWQPGPEGVADTSQDVGEGGDGLGIPGGSAGTQATLPTQAVGDQEPAEEAQQDRGGAGNGRRRPLALGFHAQMGAHLLEGDLHLPALQVGGEDGGRGPVGVGAEQGLGFAAPGRVAQEQPAQGDGGLARVVPEGRAGGDLEMSPGAVGPALVGQPCVIVGCNMEGRHTNGGSCRVSHPSLVAESPHVPQALPG